jgi:colicin import membrane protein
MAGDALRRQARLAEAEAHSYAVAMARGYRRSNLDSLQRRVPSPARVEQENRELAGAIAARDEAVAEAARDRARFHAQLAGLQAAAQAAEVAAAQAAASEAMAAQAATEEAEARSMARRIMWDSSLAKALERRR